MAHLTDICMQRSAAARPSAELALLSGPVSQLDSPQAVAVFCAGAGASRVEVGHDATEDL